MDYGALNEINAAASERVNMNLSILPLNVFSKSRVVKE